jgi:hypothetical protein
MREGINVEVSAADRARLDAVVADRDSARSTSGAQGSSWLQLGDRARRRDLALAVLASTKRRSSGPKWPVTPAIVRQVHLWPAFLCRKPMTD